MKSGMAQIMKGFDIEMDNPDRNLYEFDLNLWQLVARIAREDTLQAAELFHAEADVMESLAKATVSDLEMLSSGVLLSFKLITPESDVMNMLKEEYDPLVFVNGSIQEFDSAFWMLMNSMARDHVDAAALAFGVSNELAQAVSMATMNQLRHLATQLPTTFEFRCSGTLIKNIIDTHVGDRTPFIIKKIQMNLLATGKGDWAL